jgi:hypothetical protein
MCYVLTCVFYRRIKSRCVWLNVKQCTQSSTGRHNVYTASWQSSSAYGCNRPKSSERATALGPLKVSIGTATCSCKKAKVRKSARQWSERSESDPLIICCDDIFWKEWLNGILIRNYARYLEEINIREDKLLLYHCLLELGSPNVNVSEHLP